MLVLVGTGAGPDGRGTKAEETFRSLLDLASPLGLFSEELDPATGAFLGNYPQALTHAAMVQAALALRDSKPTGHGN
ncbi:glycoside hydrolase family 15 protein [Pseudarthrobacter defluvii]|uniref:glycoside hydrolase family 15 protein n=1 Tax=Pseudarthrobacter defluvii TaxID=410837 RepID=UPI003522F1E1